MNLKQILRSIREAKATVGPRGNRPSLQSAFDKVKAAAGEYITNPEAGRALTPAERKQSLADAKKQLKHKSPGAKGTS